MSNQLTQAELELAKQAGFSFRGDPGLEGAGIWFEPPNGSQRYFVHVAPELAKFAQLIQQRQGGGGNQITVDKTELLHSIRAVVKDALLTSIKGMDLVYAWERADYFTNKHISEIHEISLPTVDAPQLVAQALEKAAQLVDEAIASPNVSLLWVVDEIRALIDQPVEH